VISCLDAQLFTYLSAITKLMERKTNFFRNFSACPVHHKASTENKKATHPKECMAFYEGPYEGLPQKNQLSS